MRANDLIDARAGETAFVVGSGPSLAGLDVDLMRGHVVFAVNSSISKLTFADYFVADDIGVKHWDYYQHVLPNETDAVALLYEKRLAGEAGHLPADRVAWFEHKWWYDPQNEAYNPEGLVMTKHEPIIGARTAGGSAVHLAHLMGCSPIVLLGMDCCYRGRKRYFWQMDGERRCRRLNGEPVFSWPNRGLYQGRPVDAHCMAFVEYWQALADAAGHQGVSIYDASDGVLDCFPRCSLEGAIGDGG